METKIINAGNCIVYFGGDKKVIIKQDLSEHAITKRSFLLLELLNFLIFVLELLNMNEL